jgi:hypothetical protein
MVLTQISFALANRLRYTQKNRTVRLLFVGNLSRLKGADLLPGIMRKL